MTIPTITLNDGHHIPQLGFGVFKVPPAATAATVTTAFAIGYRHIDTAEMYENEKGVGEAVAASAIAREELYITSKLNNTFHRPDDVRPAFERTLADLGLEYLDLFLIHWPLPTRYDGDYVSTWRAMTKLTQDGRARSVGVSNFQPDHLKRIVDETGVVPAVNQVEVHPFFTNEDVRAANAEYGVATEAWSPIARGAVNDDPTMRTIAEEVGRTPAQVALRWHVERGDIVFPKSMSPERMRENFEVFDFSLTPEQVRRISALDQGEAGRMGPNPDVFDWVPR